MPRTQHVDFSFDIFIQFLQNVPHHRVICSVRMPCGRQSRPNKQSEGCHGDSRRAERRSNCKETYHGGRQNQMMDTYSASMQNIVHREGWATYTDRER
eukprot:6182419-Pleurochrysis_carterae.AAC.1